MVQRPKKIDASKYHAYALCCALQAEIALPNHDIQKVVAVKKYGWFAVSPAPTFYFARH
ncbi:MAG: hypothetical protein V2I51_16555 [Anderseniella sp.]|jgi:hypothetical protein|nr:hypothetical protein [Anderseniella sp.]